MATVIEVPDAREGKGGGRGAGVTAVREVDALAADDNG